MFAFLIRLIVLFLIVHWVRKLVRSVLAYNQIKKTQPSKDHYQSNTNHRSNDGKTFDADYVVLED